MSLAQKRLFLPVIFVSLLRFQSLALVTHIQDCYLFSVNCLFHHHFPHFLPNSAIRTVICMGKKFFVSPIVTFGVQCRIMRLVMCKKLKYSRRKLTSGIKILPQHSIIFYTKSISALKQTCELRGMASTLRMRTSASAG